MVLKFKEKTYHISWEYFVGPVLILLAIILAIVYRVGQDRPEPVSLEPEKAASAAVEPLPRASAVVPSAMLLSDAEEEDESYNASELLPDEGLSLKVNINTASMDELIALPYIGEAKAKAIIEYRTANGPFKSIDELIYVKGIGVKTLDKLREYITAE